MSKKKTDLIFIIILIVFFVAIGVLLFLTFGLNKGIRVTFVYEDGTKQEVTLEEGEYLQLPEDQVMEGSIFCGWMNQNGKYVINTSKVENGDIIHPVFIDGEESYYHLTFISDENILGEVNLVEDADFTLPVSPQKEGYLFSAWLDDNNHVIANKTTIMEDRVFYSLWVNESSDLISVNINTTGGNEYNPYYLERGSSLILPENPIKNGYLFDHWTNENGEEVDGFYHVSQNILIKAVWKHSYICPSDCEDLGDGRCKKIDTIDYQDTGKCEDGFEFKDGGCFNFKDKYYADFSDSEPKCRGNDYLYYEVDHLAADVWCAPRGNVISEKGCPKGYKDTGTNCQKQEIVNCS